MYTIRLHEDTLNETELLSEILLLEIELSRACEY